MMARVTSCCPKDSAGGISYLLSSFPRTQEPLHVHQKRHESYLDQSPRHRSSLRFQTPTTQIQVLCTYRTRALSKRTSFLFCLTPSRLSHPPLPARSLSPCSSSLRFSQMLSLSLSLSPSRPCPCAPSSLPSRTRPSSITNAASSTPRPPPFPLFAPCRGRGSSRSGYRATTTDRVHVRVRMVGRGRARWSGVGATRGDLLRDGRFYATNVQATSVYILGCRGSLCSGRRMVLAARFGESGSWKRAFLREEPE